MAALCIVGSGSEPAYEQVMYQAGVGAEIARRPEVIGLWVPSQERFESQTDQIEEMPGRLLHLSVHRTQVETDDGDAYALYTRGMRRLGFPELFVEDPEQLETADMIDALLVIADNVVRAGRVPQAGDTVRTPSRRAKALLHEAPDPVTGEPALNIEFERKRFLGLF